jgi:hypothetical protein
MKGSASLLREPLGKLTVSVGVGLADVVQALLAEPLQFVSLPDSEAPKLKQCPDSGEQALTPPMRRPMERHLKICQHRA